MANSNIRKHCQQNHTSSKSKEKCYQNIYEPFIGRIFLENL